MMKLFRSQWIMTERIDQIGTCLDNIGHRKTFHLNEIDLFAFENNQNSFTATRITASFLKGIATALKPLILIEDNSENNLDVEN